MLNKKLVFLSLLLLVAINSPGACPPPDIVTIQNDHFTAQWIGLTWTDPNPTYGHKLTGSKFTEALVLQDTLNPNLNHYMRCWYKTQDGHGFILSPSYYQDFWIIGPNWNLYDDTNICKSTSMNIFDCPFDRYNK